MHVQISHGETALPCLRPSFAPCSVFASHVHMHSWHSPLSPPEPSYPLRLFSPRNWIDQRFFCCLQIVFRVVGTIVGASLGQVILSIPWLVSSPGHMLLGLTAATAITSPWVETPRVRVGVGLALFTLLAVVLCPYNNSCHNRWAQEGGPGVMPTCLKHGDVTSYLTRMLSVSWKKGMLWVGGCGRGVALALAIMVP